MLFRFFEPACLSSFPETAGIFTLSFVIALSGALMPGPLLSLVVAESVRRGRRAGVLISGGHAFLEAVTIMLIAGGLVGRLSGESARAAVELSGAAILLFLGALMTTASPVISGAGDLIPPTKGSDLLLFAKGITVSAANPYWLLWWLTVGVGFMMSFRHGGVLSFFLGHACADFGWYCLVSEGITRGRKSITPKTYRTITRVCGIFLTVFALSIGIRALARVLH